MQLQQHEANDFKTRMKNEVKRLGTLFKNCLQVYELGFNTLPSYNTKEGLGWKYNNPTVLIFDPTLVIIF